MDVRGIAVPKKLFGQCATANGGQAFGSHSVEHWQIGATTRALAAKEIKKRIAGHYRDPDLIRSDLERIGAAETAKVLKEKFPTALNAQSGDLGEILATEYIEETAGYSVPVRKLRYRDDRNLALRGDDVLGFRVNANDKIEVLKAEAKSKGTLTQSTVTSAVKALDRDAGKPRAHSVLFIVDRLRESTDDVKKHLGEKIQDDVVSSRLPLTRMRHLFFAVRGKGSDTYIEAAVKELENKPPYRQATVVTIPNYSKFINTVYAGNLSLEKP